MPVLSVLSKANLDPFFAHVLNLGKTARRKYPGFERLVEQYRTRLDEDSELPDIRMLLHDGLLHEMYSQTVILPGCQYEMIWSVPLAQKVIDQGKATHMNFWVPTIANFVDASNLKPYHLQAALNNPRPIIVADYPCIRALVVIDGNHRVYSRYLAGQPYVEGYRLSPELHMQAMASDYHRTLYKVNTNLSVILGYMLNSMTMEQVQKDLLPL